VDYVSESGMILEDAVLKLHVSKNSEVSGFPHSIEHEFSLECHAIINGVLRIIPGQVDYMALSVDKPRMFKINPMDGFQGITLSIIIGWDFIADVRH